MKRWYEIRERGSRWGIRVSLWLVRIFGYRIGRIVVYLVSAYFIIFAPTVRQWCSVFHRRAVGKTSFWMSYRTLANFSLTIVDRILIQMGRAQRFRITVQGEEVLRRYKKTGKGVIIIGSHLGSLEVAPAVADLKGVRVAMLMYEQQSSMLYQELERINPRLKEDLIQMNRDSLSYMLEVRDRFKRGDYIGILGDRTWLSGETLWIPFLGVKRPFPIGPYHLAAVLKAPVLIMIVAKEGVWDYRCYVEELSAPLQVPAKDRQDVAEALARRYVERLEDYCRKYPLQWYNFFNFWEEGVEETGAEPTSAPVNS